MYQKCNGSQGRGINRKEFHSRERYHVLLTYYTPSCVQAGVPLMLIVFVRGECGVHGMYSHAYLFWRREYRGDNRGSSVLTRQIYDDNNYERFKFAKYFLIRWARQARCSETDSDGAYRCLY